TDVSNIARGDQKPKAYPMGWRALQLPDANTDDYFLRSFGRPAREITCECERTAEPSVTQALHLSNGDTINQKLEAKESCVRVALESQKSDEQILEDAYLRTLSRFPAETEKTRILQ